MNRVPEPGDLLQLRRIDGTEVRVIVTRAQHSDQPGLFWLDYVVDLSLIHI